MVRCHRQSTPGPQLTPISSVNIRCLHWNSGSLVFFLFFPFHFKTRNQVVLSEFNFTHTCMPSGGATWKMARLSTTIGRIINIYIRYLRALLPRPPKKNCHRVPQSKVEEVTRPVKWVWHGDNK